MNLLGRLSYFIGIIASWITECIENIRSIIILNPFIKEIFLISGLFIILIILVEFLLRLFERV